ncbi:hypothetical protein GCM10010109_45970 [Actinoplanes campanulatus]|nr:hypothetical protein GCM10010109_45970 [Actinoplanes campanulatus]GID37911.1 hypothetical protein Aca09nite_44170 [Actinoplanes campanulatus]
MQCGHRTDADLRQGEGDQVCGHPVAPERGQQGPGGGRHTDGAQRSRRDDPYLRALVVEQGVDGRGPATTTSAAISPVSVIRTPVSHAVSSRRVFMHVRPVR